MDTTTPRAAGVTRRSVSSRLASGAWRAAVLVVNAGFVYVGLTALVMVHGEDYFRSLFPPGLNEQNSSKRQQRVTAAQLADCPVGFAAAMKRVGDSLGDADINYVQMYVDRAGHTVWKTLTRESPDGAVMEVLVDAHTGEYTVTKRDGYYRERTASDGTVLQYVHYAKLATGLHTGKFYGPLGEAAMTVFAVLAIFVPAGTGLRWILARRSAGSTPAR